MEAVEGPAPVSEAACPDPRSREVSPEVLTEQNQYADLVTRQKRRVPSIRSAACAAVIARCSTFTEA